MESMSRFGMHLAKVKNLHPFLFIEHTQVFMMTPFALTGVLTLGKYNVMFKGFPPSALFLENLLLFLYETCHTMTNLFNYLDFS